MKKLLFVCLVLILCCTILTGCSYLKFFTDSSEQKNDSTDTPNEDSKDNTEVDDSEKGDSCDKEESDNNESEDKGSENNKDEQVIINGINYTLSNDGTYYEVTGIGSNSGSDVVIQSTCNDLPVASIANNAFLGCTSITCVTIPDSVTNIGEYAFKNCSNLTSVFIGDEYCNSAEMALRSGGTKPPKQLTKSINSHNDSNKVTNVGKDAFDNCDNLKGVYVTDIEKWCYFLFVEDRSNPLRYAKKLYLNGELVKDLVIPEGVTRIESNTFAHCVNLKSIVIPDSVARIGHHAFYGCDNLIVTENGIRYVHRWAIGYEGDLISAKLRQDTVGIADCAFYDCTSLSNVSLPNSLRYIGEEALAFCTNITSITIPKNVSSVGYRAFGVANIEVAESNKYYKSIDGNLYSKDGTVLVRYATEKTDLTFTVPKEVKTIDDFAFYNSSNLAYVAFNNKLKSIGNNAFEQCNHIISAQIPDSVTSIGKEAFSGTGLTNITLGNGLSSIGECAFPHSNLFYIVNHSNHIRLKIGSEANDFLTCQAKILVDNGITTYANDGYKYVLTDDNFLFKCNNNRYELIAYCGNNSTVTLPKSIYNSSYTMHDTRGFVNVIIPEGVTSIDWTAFYGCDSLLSVVLSDTVTHIGEMAFYFCSNLKSIYISDSLTSIGFDAFGVCQNLENVYIKDIAKWCNISFGVGVESALNKIYANPLAVAENFYINNELIEGELKIPNGVTNISAYAFIDCPRVTSIVIPDTVTNIGEMAFSVSNITVDENNNHYKSIDGNLYSKDGSILIRYAIGKTNNSFSIPNTVTKIADKAFYNCVHLTKITIIDSITSIGNETFTGCKGLTSINIPCNLAYIGERVFNGCDNLTEVTLEDGLTEILPYMFSDCRNITTIVIPDSVTTIGSQAFYGCKNLTNVTIGNGVTNIGSFAFSGCNIINVHIKDIEQWCNISFYDSGSNPLFSKSNLYLNDEIITRLVVDSSITNLNNYAFYGCISLESVTINIGVTGIGEYTFWGCTNLKEVIIPDSVTKIGKWAFSYCANLSNINIPDSITSIAENTFCGCTNLTSINIPDGVISIGTGAFYNCSALSSVIIPDSVTELGDAAFADCTNITNITIGNGITSLSRNEFANCINLVNIEIPANVENITVKAFSGCKSLAKITVSSNNVFYSAIDGSLYSKDGKILIIGALGKTDIIINEGTTTIGDEAFANSENLTNITIPNSVTIIGKSAFYNCDKLTNVLIPDSVNIIDDGAFNDCSNLASINIPNSVTSIGFAAFSSCNSLESILIPNSVTYIGTFAFLFCDITIYCEANSQPDGWSEGWDAENLYVVWGHISVDYEE